MAAACAPRRRRRRSAPPRRPPRLQPNPLDRNRVELPSPDVSKGGAGLRARAGAAPGPPWPAPVAAARAGQYLRGPAACIGKWSLPHKGSVFEVWIKSVYVRECV